jgi:hypothetical protein
MYTKEIVLKPNLALGYKYFVDKEHPLATGNSGRVLFHRHIVSVHLGYWITSEDVVHHKDGNKLNNDIPNLEVLTRSEHSIEHTRTVRLEDKICPLCGKTYHPHHNTQIYCSRTCYFSDIVKKTGITKEVLEEEMPYHTWGSLGALFGYSDVGIKKRAISLGCDISLKGSKYKEPRSCVRIT